MEGKLKKKSFYWRTPCFFVFFATKKDKNTPTSMKHNDFIRKFPVIFALFNIPGNIGGVVVASKVPPMETQWKQTHGDLLRSTVWIVRRKRWSNPLPRCSGVCNTWWRKNPLKFQFWQLTHPPWNQHFDVDKPWKSTIKWSGMPHFFLNRPMILLVDLFSFWEADKEKDDLIENFLYTKVFEGVWGGWDYVFWSRLFPSTVDHRIMAVVWQLFFDAPSFLGEIDFLVNQKSTKSTSSCMVPRSFLLLTNQSGLQIWKCLFFSCWL